MSAKTASSGATAKPCLPLMIEVPASMIDDAECALENIETIIHEELAVRVGAISYDGALTELGDDEESVDNLRAVAEGTAAYCAVGDLIQTIRSIRAAAQANEAAQHPLQDGLDALKAIDDVIGRVLFPDVARAAPGTNPEADAEARIAKRDTRRKASRK